MIRALLQTLRIRHWIKNFFVLAPFLTGPHFGINEFLVRSLLGVFLFSLMSSSVYIVNDIIDIDSDKKHPEKKFRPIASGHLPVNTAKWLSACLFLVTLSCSYFLNFKFFLVLLLYAANNLIYSFVAKNKTVLDVMFIAFGFVLRLYAGGFIIDIVVTKWMVACVFCLSIYLGFGKRRCEIEDLDTEAPKVRKVHESYNIPKLNLLLGISASITIVSYILYTMSPDTIALHKTDNLIFTTPFVIYCIFRYSLKIQEKRRGGGPVAIILKDKAFLLSGFFWITSFLLFVHL